MTDEAYREWYERHTLCGACERLRRAGRDLWDATRVEPVLIHLLDAFTGILRRLARS